jgi:hypothetical protein
MLAERRTVQVDGAVIDVTGYVRMHEKRIAGTLAKAASNGVRRVIEVGSHPWVMTSALIEHPRFELLATVSAQEATRWPDDIGLTAKSCEIRTLGGESAKFLNYSFNIERRRALLEESPDIVFACEIIEHLIRSPHTMLLNINDWLPLGGELIVTTPNGSQFMNPFRRAARMPAYRAHCYERHSYVYRLEDLVELIELCGFSILEAGFWSPYKSGGLNAVRPIVARIPGAYFSEKFERSLYVVAKKQRSVAALPRIPSVYAQSGAWEDILSGKPTAAGAERH